MLSCNRRKWQGGGEQGSASGGGGATGGEAAPGGPVLELGEMFPGLRDISPMRPAACGGDAELAAERLLAG